MFSDGFTFLDIVTASYVQLQGLQGAELRLSRHFPIYTNLNLLLTVLGRMRFFLEVDRTFSALILPPYLHSST